MPNVFQTLGTVPIMSTIQDMLQRQANLERTQVSTQILGQQSQLMQQQVQSEKKFNEGLANLDAAKNAKQTSDALNSGVPQDFAPFAGTDAGKPIIEGYKSETQAAKQARDLAGVAAQAGDFKKQKQFEQEAEAASGRARQWYNEGLTLAQNQRKELASVASSYADDGSNLQDVVDAVKGLNPKALLGAQFNRDPEGNIMAGPRTKAAFETIANTSMSRVEQLSAKREADKIKQDAISNELRDKRETEKERMDDVRAAALQHGMAVQDRRETEKERMDDVRAAALQHGMAVQDRRLALAEKAQSDTKDQNLLESRGAMVATGAPLTAVVPGWGGAAVKQREQAQKEGINQIKNETGMDDKAAGKELAQRQIDYVAGRRSTTQLNTMLGATRQAVAQLDFNIDQTKKILNDIPSTDLSPVLNAMVRGEQRWTGDPRYASLFYYMHATAMESARILQGGQASIAQLHQGAAEEAKKWADIGLTPKMFDSVSKAMRDEGDARIRTYEGAMKQQRVGAEPAPPREQESPPPAAPASIPQGWSVTVKP